MGLLFQHCLLVMFVLGICGHVAFWGLHERYIRKRWTRLARSGFFRVMADIPRSISQLEEERYTTLHAQFGAVVRMSYQEEILSRLLSKNAEMLVTYANKGIEELTNLLQNGFTIHVPSSSDVRANQSPMQAPRGIVPPTSFKRDMERL
ncbi:hypothetical protein LINPERPRIM_LOCUS31358 [Linum perenne]